jgi:cobalamin-dependent methionine synthase I
LAIEDASVLIIGERTNANGSKAFREAMPRIWFMNASA